MWLFEQDRNARDAALFHGWRYPLHDPEARFDPPVPWLERDRSPLPPGFPAPAYVVAGGPWPDLLFAEERHLVVSAALLDALRPPPEAAQVRPVALFAHDRAGAGARGGYSLVRVLASAPCMDRARSEWEEHEYTSARTGRPDRAVFARRFVLDASAAPPADLFWAEEKPGLLVATEALAARVLDRAGGPLTGAAFLDPSGLDEWGQPTRRRLPGGGGLAPYADLAIGHRPLRPPAERPAYVPDPALPEALRPVEAAARHRLPGYYVRFLLDPPARLLSCEGSRMELSTDPERVAELNRHVRDDGGSEVTWLREGAPWPEDWLVVGEDGCGNYYFLDLGAAVSPVLLYDHDAGGGDAQVVHPTLAHHAEAVAREYLGPEWRGGGG